jgi:hypothetical protein
MATPIYTGNAQPPVNSGWLGGLGSWFGIVTPAYAGATQPAASSSGYFSGTTPTYRSAPAQSQPTQPSDDGERITLVVPRGLVPSELLSPQS